MDNMDFVDVSDDAKQVHKDIFMIKIYISLIILLFLGLLVYFFGYDILKPFIKV